MMGKVAADWWCIVDSIFVSLQKIVKVKKITEESKAEEEAKKGSSPFKRNPGSNQSPSK